MSVVLLCILLASSYCSAQVITLDWSISTGDVGTSTIAVGDSVTWRMTDELPHTVTSTTNVFDSGIQFGSGSTWSFQFNNPGTFPYRCDFHEQMVGVIVVRATLPSLIEDTFDPTEVPTPVPTPAPIPTAEPTTALPTTALPTTGTPTTEAPITAQPTTQSPTTSQPTTGTASAEASLNPTTDPTADPTSDPTTDPTSDPTTDPTSEPTVEPTLNPTEYYKQKTPETPQTTRHLTERQYHQPRFEDSYMEVHHSGSSSGSSSSSSSSADFVQINVNA